MHRQRYLHLYFHLYLYLYLHLLFHQNKSITLLQEGAYRRRAKQAGGWCSRETKAPQSISVFVFVSAKAQQNFCTKAHIRGEHSRMVLVRGWCRGTWNKSAARLLHRHKFSYLYLHLYLYLYLHVYLYLYLICICDFTVFLKMLNVKTGQRQKKVCCVHKQ